MTDSVQEDQTAHHESIVISGFSSVVVVDHKNEKSYIQMLQTESEMKTQQMNSAQVEVTMLNTEEILSAQSTTEQNSVVLNDDEEDNIIEHNHSRQISLSSVLLNSLVEEKTFVHHGLNDQNMHQNQYTIQPSTSKAHVYTETTGRRKCCAKECQSATNRSDRVRNITYTFPPTIVKGYIHEENIARCKQWVLNSGNENLHSIPTAGLYKKYFICNKHFCDDQFYNLDRKTLLPTAVPTLFCNSTTNDKSDYVLVHGHRLDLFADVNPHVTFENRSTYYRKHKCAVFNCPSMDSELIRYFPFPNICYDGKLKEENLARCIKWIQNTGNSDLLEVDVLKIHEEYEICEHHFADSEFENGMKKRLKSNAIPRLCDVTPLSDNNMMQLFTFLNTADFAQRKMSFETSETTQLIQTVNNEVNCDFIQPHSKDQTLDQYQKNFNDEMNSIQWYTCDNCKESFLSKRQLKRPCLRNKTCDLYSSENDMDPGDVPEELSDLSYIEEQLIARVHPVVSVYKIKGQQYGYSGNVINFPQSVSEFAKKLPHKISDLSSVITVRSQNKVSPKEFHIRADKIRKALEWLKVNNHYYYDVDISEEHLNLLPEDGNLYDDVVGIDIDDENAANNQDANQTVQNDEEEIPPIICDSSVPQVDCSNQNDKVKNVFEWPTVGKEPLNEFKTIGYIAQAFPCLFPSGKADINAPRDKKIKPSEYFKHMLRYKDKRFMKHPRFCFFALNSLMRWNALQSGNLFVKKHEELKDLTIDQLKQKIKNNPKLIKKIMFQCSNMRGTKPYWKARCQELMQMIEQLKMPTLFFTLSAADLHWPGLFKLLAPEQDIDNLTSNQRSELIQKFPIIVDQYFSERVESFLNRVLVPKYKVKDFWYRIEYQHRGSPHVHGLLWLQNAPDVSNITELPVENVKEIIQYFDELVSTTHPNVNCPPAVVHPCRKKLEDIIDFERDIAELLNRVQRHTKCTDGYCLKFNKTTKKKQCRFKFPKEMTDESVIQTTEKGETEFVSKRNDPLLNKYNRYIIQTWRANIDIAPVLSKRALINYLAKYVSKAEPKSKSLEETLKHSLQNMQQNKTAKSAIQSLYIRACSERDYSAQEVGHIIMGEKFVSAGGRDFVSIYFTIEDGWTKVPSKQSTQKGMSILEKYKRRSNQHNNKSLWHMAKHYILPSEKKRSKEAIVLVYPNIKLKENDICNENYYKLKVLLHLPWRNETDFNSPDSFISWEDLYNKNLHEIQKESPDQIMQDVERTANEEELELENDENCNHCLNVRDEDWMVASRMHPDQNLDEIELGRRAIDVAFNWNESLSKYEQYGSYESLQSFISKAKEQYNSSRQTFTLPQVKFTDEQEKVITLLEKQIQQLNEMDNPNSITNTVPKVVIVQGQAGTGKSLLIQACASKIQAIYGKDAVLLLGPTGVASLNIGGHTIHSKLHVSLNMPFNNLKNQSERKFIDDMEPVKFLIIDEFSMVGCNLMAQIDKRCRQATGNYEEDFGGYYVLFFGDIRQLPPVGDIPLYTGNPPSSAMAIHGKMIFDRISIAIVLSQVTRQVDTKFKTLLENMSRGCITDNDFKLISTRFKSSVSFEDRKKFDDALRLFPTKAKVHSYNKECLTSLLHPITNQRVPIARIEAEHNCYEASKGSTDDAGGLKSVLYLAQHAKIMLKLNLWTEMGLVNGARGTVIDILYENGCQPPDHRPILLICHFPEYSGPYLGNNINQKLLPISPVQRSWTASNGDSCTRTTFPVIEAYASSIHTSQGLTLSLVSVDIGESDFSPGLSYVALSRAKSLEGLLLENFTKERFLRINKSKTILLRNNLLDKLLQNRCDSYE